MIYEITLRVKTGDNGNGKSLDETIKELSGGFNQQVISVTEAKL